LSFPGSVLTDMGPDKNAIKVKKCNNYLNFYKKISKVSYPSIKPQKAYK